MTIDVKGEGLHEARRRQGLPKSKELLEGFQAKTDQLPSLQRNGSGCTLPMGHGSLGHVPPPGAHVYGQKEQRGQRLLGDKRPSLQPDASPKHLEGSIGIGELYTEKQPDETTHHGGEYQPDPRVVSSSAHA